MASETELFRKAIAPCAYSILKGKVLAIDPGSNSLGWALFNKGEYLESGVATANPKGKPHSRIISIMHDLCEATDTSIDVLCVEKMFRYNAGLVWSVGAVIHAKSPDLFVEVPVRMWQARVGADYVKSDEQDAIEIGTTLIFHASKL